VGSGLLQIGASCWYCCVRAVDVCADAVLRAAECAARY